MNQTAVHYELYREDARGLHPLGESYHTRDEAEADRRHKAGSYAFYGAFVVRVTITRVGPRRAHALTAV